MGNWNGFVASLTKDGSAGATTLLSGISSVTVASAIPSKHFHSGQYGVVVTQGVSGAFAVNIIGGIGGATYVTHGRSSISAVGSYPIPMIHYGNSGNVSVNAGVPRPYLVQFEAAKAASGFTASVYFSGSY